MLANESTFVTKLLDDLIGKRGREGGLEDGFKGRNAGSDGGVCKAVLGSAGGAWANANGALPIESSETFLPPSSDASRGARAPDRRGAGSLGTARGEKVECADLLELVVAAMARPTDSAAAAAAPVSMTFRGPEAVKPFSSSDAGGNVLSELVVDILGLIGGLIGVGLVMADVGLVT